MLGHSGTCEFRESWSDILQICLKCLESMVRGLMCQALILDFLGRDIPPKRLEHDLRDVRKSEVCKSLSQMIWIKAICATARNSCVGVVSRTYTSIVMNVSKFHQFQYDFVVFKHCLDCKTQGHRPSRLSLSSTGVRYKSFLFPHHFATHSFRLPTTRLATIRTHRRI